MKKRARGICVRSIPWNLFVHSSIRGSTISSIPGDAHLRRFEKKCRRLLPPLIDYLDRKQSADVCVESAEEVDPAAMNRPLSVSMRNLYQAEAEDDWLEMTTMSGHALDNEWWPNYLPDFPNTWDWN